MENGSLFKYHERLVYLTEKIFEEHVEAFVRRIKQNQFQTRSDMKLDKKDAHFVVFFSHQKISDVFAVRQF
jgi:hypothetical protein